MGSKTYVNSVTQRMLDTDNYVSSNDYGMARYLMEQKDRLRPNVNSTTIAECLVQANASSLPKKFKNAYRFAKDKSKYVYGVPMSSISTDAVNDVKEGLKAYLVNLEGKPLTFEYIKLNSKNLYHYAWKEVIDTLKYSFTNNELKTLSIKEGVPAYLKSSQLYISQSSLDILTLDGNLDQNGLDIGNTAQPEMLIGLTDKLAVTYTYTKGIELLEGTIELDLSHVVKKVVISPDIDVIDKVETELEYLQTMYHNGDTYKLFEYAYMSGGIPAIDMSESYQEEFGQYYPRIYIRQDANDTIGLAATDQKRIDTKKLLHTVGIDLADFTESIRESIEGINNNYKYIFLHLTVSINKEMNDQTTGKYLFNYFDTLYGRSEVTTEVNNFMLVNEKKGITQEVTDGTYTQLVNYWKSGKETKAGVATNNLGVILQVGEYYIKYSSAVTASESGFPTITGKHTIYRQDSTNQYTVITILGLEMIHRFYGKSIRCKGDDEGLTIPLDLSVVNTLKGKEQDLLLNKAFQITVTTLQVVKKKWYESGIFKVVMAVASIVMNMFIPGSGFVLSALLGAVVTTIVVSIAIKVLMTLALELAISLGISAEVLGILTAIVAIGVAAYGGGKFDFSKMFNAKEALKTLNYSVDMYQQRIGKNIEQIRKDMDLFGKYADSEIERLKDAQAMLDTGMVPPTLEMLTSPTNNVDIYLGESPQDFYTRTVGLDIVDLSYNMEAYFLAASTIIPIQKFKREVSLAISDVLLIN